MTRGHPTQGGDDDLTLFRSKANRASGVIFSLAAALVIGWLGVVEPIRIDLEEFVNRSYTDASKKAMDEILNHVQRRVNRDQNRAATLPDVNTENILLFATEQEARAFARAESLYRESQLRYKTVDPFRQLNFLGFSVPVPWIVGSLSWSLACTFLIFYVNFKRQSLFDQLMDARSLYESRSGAASDDDLGDFAGVAPFWLAPVYWHGHDAVAQGKLRSTLGWDDFQEKAATILSLIFAIGIILALCRVTYVGFLITDNNNDLRELLGISKRAFTVLLLVDAILVALVLLALVGMIAWFLGSMVAPETVSDHRRIVVGGGAAFVVGGSVVGALGLSSIVSWPSFREAPRARGTASRDAEQQQGQDDKVSRGFYLNPVHPVRKQFKPDKKPRVHYADANGYFLDPSSAPGSRRTATEDIEQIVEGLVFQDFTRAIELNFLEATEGGNADKIASAMATLEKACDFQLSGKLRSSKDAPPHISFRLLDLLGRIYGIAGQTEKLTDLSQRAESLAEGEDLSGEDVQRLKKRAAEWRGEKFQDWVANQSSWTFYVEQRGLEIDLPDVIL